MRTREDASVTAGGHGNEVRPRVLVLYYSSYGHVATLAAAVAEGAGGAGAEVVVRRNDALSVDEALAMKPDGIVISPGPCDPAQAGICLDQIRARLLAQGWTGDDLTGFSHTPSKSRTGSHTTSSQASRWIPEAPTT